ncbi:MAG: zinc-ribbon domain-containing protein [Candidatus Hermodarchaeota archaeon]
MSSNNAFGYCPSCKQNVLLVREAANWALIILLIILTGGIGLIVYAIIYYNKPPSRCIHCHSQIAVISTSSAQTANQIPNGTPLKEESDINDVDSTNVDKTSKQRFCPFCGEPLQSQEAQFCAHCGSKV